MTEQGTASMGEAIEENAVLDIFFIVDLYSTCSGHSIS